MKLQEETTKRKEPADPKGSSSLQVGTPMYDSNIIKNIISNVVQLMVIVNTMR